MADSLTFSTLPAGEGYAYEILENGSRIIFQMNDPDLPGNEAMSETRASEAAQAVVDRLLSAASVEAVAPETVQPDGVPAVVSMAQARKALFLAGFSEKVEAAIAAIPSPHRELAEIDWNHSTSVRRDSQLVAALGPSLGLDDAAIDALFVAAAHLT